jgi:hypothetical protein
VHTPPLPTVASTQLIFIWGGSLVAFTGYPGTKVPIIQPVLTYGANGGMGGQYWYVADWYIDSYGNASTWYIGPSFGSISPGDQFNMQVWVADNACTLSGNGCNWNMAGWMSNWSPTTVRINAVPGVFNAVYRGVMENYPYPGAGTGNPGCPCNQLPGGPGNSMSFISAQVTQPLSSPTDFTHYMTPTWTGNQHATSYSCNYLRTPAGSQVNFTW